MSCFQNRRESGDTFISAAVHQPVQVEARLLMPEDSFLFEQFRREIFIGEIIRRGTDLF